MSLSTRGRPRSRVTGGGGQPAVPGSANASSTPASPAVERPSVEVVAAPAPTRSAWGTVPRPASVTTPAPAAINAPSPSKSAWPAPRPSQPIASVPRPPAPAPQPSQPIAPVSRPPAPAALPASNAWSRGSPLKAVQPAAPAPAQNPWNRGSPVVSSAAEKLESQMKTVEISIKDTSRPGSAGSASSSSHGTPLVSASSSLTSSPPSPEKKSSSLNTPRSGRSSKLNTPRDGLVPIQEINPKLTVLGPSMDDPAAIRPLRNSRPETISRHQTIRIRANHFPVAFNMKNFPEKVYHYDVVITPKEAKNVVPELSESTVPDRLLHEVWQTFEEKYWKKLGARMPFDGKKNCYTVTPLDLGGNAVWSDELRMKDPDDDDKMRSFRIQLKYANEVATSVMWNYLGAYKDWQRVNLPQEVIQALDVALRYSPAFHYTPCNRSFYSDKNPHSISQLLELWFGHNQSLLLGRDERATLNIDMANKAFIKKMPVVKLLEYILNKYPDKMETGKWEPGHFKEANDFLKGKLLQYGTGRFINGRFEKLHRFVCVEVVQGYDAASYNFKLNGVETTIKEYFEKGKGIKLQHPDWPVIHVGNKNMTNYVPLELLEIMPQAYKGKLEARDTSEMIKGAAKPPEDRFIRIQKSRDECRFEKCPILKDFGMEVKPRMVEINAKKLPLPQLNYCDARNARITQAPRGPDGKFIVGKFLEPAKVPQVAVLNAAGKFSRQNQTDIRTFLAKLGSEAGMLGMTSTKRDVAVADLFAKARVHEVNARPVRSNLDQLSCKIRDELTKIKRENPNGLVIVLMGKDGNEYPSIKSEAEVQVGILTQCVKWGTLDKIVQDKGAKQVMFNILLKINAKLRGKSFSLGSDIITSEFKFLSEPILFVGMDVTHPAPNSKSPSIAAITANYDITGMCYQMHIQLQPQTDAALEVIANLYQIIKKMVMAFKGHTSHFPKRIVVFRDGVSEGQFFEIKKEEFHKGIKAACVEIRNNHPEFEPKLTFLVVKKRHHTRFVPMNQRDGVRPKGNIPPGTVVDTDITHPTEMEFFLNSHVGIQGTSKPTRYHVIHDDCGFTMEQLEKLTYYLCYTFVRCTQPVSYPAPTYYAHLAAFRARALIEKEGDNIDIDYLTSKMTIHKDLVKNYPMFFV